jgi:thioredoxin reductase
LDAGPIGIVAASPMAQHQGLMLPDWGKPTLFLNGAYAPTQEELAALTSRGTHVEATPIDRIEGAADVVLADGRILSMSGLFTQTRARLSSPVSQQLGCEIEEGPLGEFIKVNPAQETSVPGVFACGDAARAAGSVALAVGDGALAGLAAHRSTLF